MDGYKIGNVDACSLSFIKVLLLLPISSYCRGCNIIIEPKQSKWNLQHIIWIEYYKNVNTNINDDQLFITLRANKNQGSAISTAIHYMPPTEDQDSL